MNVTHAELQAAVVRDLRLYRGEDLLRHAVKMVAGHVEHDTNSANQASAVLAVAADQGVTSAETCWLHDKGELSTGWKAVERALISDQFYMAARCALEWVMPPLHRFDLSACLKAAEEQA